MSSEPTAPPAAFRSATAGRRCGRARFAARWQAPCATTLWKRARIDAMARACRSTKALSGTVIGVAIAVPKSQQLHVGSDGAVSPLECAFEPLACRQRPQLPIEVRIRIRLAAEPDARVAAFGEAGIAHDPENDEAALVDGAVQCAGRELHIGAGRQWHAAEFRARDRAARWRRSRRARNRPHRSRRAHGRSRNGIRRASGRPTPTVA